MILHAQPRRSFDSPRAAAARRSVLGVGRRSPKPDKSTDLQQLQGEWVPVSSVLGGATLKVEHGQDIAVFKGNQLSFVSRGTASARWTVILDPARKPKTIDLRGGGLERLYCLYIRP